jgi:hypothetical protein
MTLGPGKYDLVATMAREMTKARTVVLIALNGTHGNGFSVQTEQPGIFMKLPAMLRELADQIEADYKRGKGD